MARKVHPFEQLIDALSVNDARKLAAAFIKHHGVYQPRHDCRRPPDDWGHISGHAWSCVCCDERKQLLVRTELHPNRFDAAMLGIAQQLSPDQDFYGRDESTRNDDRRAGANAAASIAAVRMRELKKELGLDEATKTDFARPAIALLSVWGGLLMLADRDISRERGLSREQFGYLHYGQARIEDWETAAAPILELYGSLEPWSP